MEDFENYHADVEKAVQFIKEDVINLSDEEAKRLEDMLFGALLVKGSPNDRSVNKPARTG